MAEQRPKRQHSVPDFYLKRFASPPTRKRGAWQVSAYNRESGKLLPKTSTGNVTVENHLYDIHDSAHGNGSQLEAWLSDQEDGWGRMLDAVLKQRHVKQDNIPELRTFIAYSYARTTSYRDRIIQLAGRHVRTEGVQNLRRKGPPEELDEYWAQKYLNKLDELESGVVRLEEDSDFILQIQFPPPSGLFKGLASNWYYVVVFSPQAKLVTSDVPVVVRDMGSGDLGEIADVGLDNASDLWFPADPQHAILLTRDPAAPKWVGDLPNREIRGWNNAISHASHRWTIWRPDTPARMYVDLPHVQSYN